MFNSQQERKLFIELNLDLGILSIHLRLLDILTSVVSPNDFR